MVAASVVFCAFTFVAFGLGSAASAPADFFGNNVGAMLGKTPPWAMVTPDSSLFNYKQNQTLASYQREFRKNQTLTPDKLVTEPDCISIGVTI